MKRMFVLTVAVTVAGALPFLAAAQTVRDFTGHEPTSDELVDALKPRPGMEGRRTRGLGVVQDAPSGKPHCKPYREAKRSRGIGTASAGSPQVVSDAAALKVEFAFNSAELTPEATKTLSELGKALTSDELKPYCFVVEGHTDNIGSDAYNLSLSELRAESVVRYLTQNFGIDPERIQPIGLGKRNPIADNSTDEGRQRNRRVQIANIGT
jgi:OOP family OmpA-OmpF porin